METTDTLSSVVKSIEKLYLSKSNETVKSNVTSTSETFDPKMIFFSTFKTTHKNELYMCYHRLYLLYSPFFWLSELVFSVSEAKKIHKFKNALL